MSDQRVTGELPTNSLDGGRARSIAAPSQTIVLVIKPSSKVGRFLGYIGDELIVTSRQPFLDGARALLARGHDSATPYNMRHTNSDVLSFVTTTVGHAAGLSVNEKRASRFQKFEPFEWRIDKAAE
jgi:hypothetical protein